MVTIKLTRDQADELMRATTYLYEKYSSRDEWPDENLRRINDEYVRKLNNAVDELREIIKEGIKNEKV